MGQKAIGQKVDATRSGSSENLDALMSVWAAIFQQQLTPETPPPVDAPAAKADGLQVRDAESKSEAALGNAVAIETLANQKPATERVQAARSEKATSGKVPAESGLKEIPRMNAELPAVLGSDGVAAILGASATAHESHKLESLATPPIAEAGNLPPVVAPTDAGKALRSMSEGAQSETSVAPVPQPPTAAGTPKPAARDTRTSFESSGQGSAITPAPEPIEVTTLNTEVHLKRAVPQRQGVRVRDTASDGDRIAAAQDAESVQGSDTEPNLAADASPHMEERKAKAASGEGAPAPEAKQQTEELPQSTRSNAEAAAVNHALLSPASAPGYERPSPAGTPAPPPPAPAARLAPPPPQVQSGSGLAKTISIRIPFAESTPGEGARHIDLVFENRNNDLTLRFHSPTSEIQQRIEESMPALMDKLQTADWTAKPPSPAGLGSAEPLVDSRRRAEPATGPAASFESNRAVAQGGASSQTGSSFDDQTSQRKDQPTQAQPGRNRKKERAWQFELDSETES